ncbi:MAG: RimK family alpha-L-glutamate ligase [Planctomycetota bacterium]
MRVALITCTQYPGLPIDDLPLLEALRRIRVEAVPVVWGGPAEELDGYDISVIRGTWDYCDRFEEFLNWVRRAGARTSLWNPAELIIWNCHKRYLKDLAARGVSIPPTLWFERGARVSLATILNETGWKRAVIKPQIGATARNTILVDAHKNELGEAHLNHHLQNEGMMVQEFLPNVLLRGEISLIFIDGEFSHAVCKRPAQGDYRVQSEFAGTTEAIVVSGQMQEYGKYILSLCPAPSLYARVDFIENESGSPVLIELECVEPELYFRPWPGSEEKMARAILNRIRP